MSRLVAYGLLLGLFVMASLIIPWVARFFIGPHALPEPLRRRIVLILLSLLAVLGSLGRLLLGEMRPIDGILFGILWLWLLFTAFRECRRAKLHRY